MERMDSDGNGYVDIYEFAHYLKTFGFNNANIVSYGRFEGEADPPGTLDKAALRHDISRAASTGVNDS